MFNIIFFILLFGVFGKLLGFAIRASWGIFKIIFTIVLLPLILIFMVFGGLIAVAFPILAIIGLVTLVKSIAK